MHSSATTSTSSYDEQAFADLQQRLVPMWPGMTIRTHESTSRAIFVVSSMSIDLPPHIAPVLPAYEERYLFMVLGLARSPLTRVIYITSQPVQQLTTSRPTTSSTSNTAA